MEEHGLAKYLFHQGTNYHSEDYLGCTFSFSEDKYAYYFRTWAPSADEVRLVSDFCGWDEGLILTRISDGGIYELKYISNEPLFGRCYKFKISKNGKSVYKGDPYARYSKGGDDGASIIYDGSAYLWGDDDYLNYRNRAFTPSGGAYLPHPINVYELHLGSFIRHEDNSYYTYRELADLLPGYIKTMGYTHVELLPVQEHPYDGSWGYQVCGFFAPTSRFGSPDDFKYLVDSLHRAGIGVILDWVPAHFPKDEWGLYEFDGSPLYEYQGADRMESSSWGTRFFDLGREEVQSFLVSSALHFFRDYHIDGLRVDAVASMIYLDYDRLPGEWIPNEEGTNENKEATAFLRKLNSAVFSEYPAALMIAEESGSRGKITSPPSESGLGFNLKWNMGFANDLYDYLMTPPSVRGEKHRALNFPIAYAFTENFVLPISHDEVVHGKRSFVDKPYGSYEDKFSEARCALLLMMTYPGKKLLFMGTELAQFREWAYDESLEWFMLDYPAHSSFRQFVRELNHLYLSRRELWELDFSPEGFSWIYPDEAEKSTVIYRRRSTDGSSLVAAVNFSDSEQTLPIELDENTALVKIFDTGNLPDGYAAAYEQDNTLYISLPRYSGVIFEERKTSVIIKSNKNDTKRRKVCTAKRNA